MLSWSWNFEIHLPKRSKFIVVLVCVGLCLNYTKILEWFKMIELSSQTGPSSMRSIHLIQSCGRIWFLWMCEVRLTLVLGEVGPCSLRHVVSWCWSSSFTRSLSLSVSTEGREVHLYRPPKIHHEVICLCVWHSHFHFGKSVGNFHLVHCHLVVFLVGYSCCLDY